MNTPWAWLMSQRVIPLYRDAMFREWHVGGSESLTSPEAKVAVAALIGEVILAWRSNPL